MTIGFRPFTRADYPVLARWRRDRAWLTWWGPARSVDELDDDYGACIDGADPTSMTIATIDGRDFALVETYRLRDHPDWAAKLSMEHAAGIDYAIKVAAQEYTAQKVRFNSIAAGLIETDMTSMFFGMDPVIQAHIDETPAGRMGNLDDMAEAALFLADDGRSGYINGQVLDLAGGQQMGHLPRF